MSERLRGAWRRALEHPLGTVAVLAAVLALLAAWRIWTAKTLGSYDPDEAGYVASALRFQRAIDLHHPLDLPREVFQSRTGPLVPALSVLLLIPGPRDPRTVLLIQPLFMWFAAVSTTGAARRLARPSLAILAGLYVATVPATLLAVGSYWFGLGALSAMSGAIWALAASDRFANRWRFGFGVAIGAMLLARTMTIGFLPGLVVAALIVAGRDRRRLLGVLQAFAVAVVVASPWYIARWSDVFTYLFGFGYGERSTDFGSGNLVQRLAGRVALLVHLEPVIEWTPVALVLAVGPVIAAVVAWRHAPPRTRPPSDRLRLTVAVAAVVALGLVVLASTSNRGVWFELPLIPPALVVSAAVLERSPRLLQTLGCVVMALVIVVGPAGVWGRGLAYSDGVFIEYDARFDRTDPQLRHEARTEWWAANRAVVAALASDTGRGQRADVVMTGNNYLVNANSLRLAAELGSWDLDPVVPDTSAGPAAWRDLLAPTTDRFVSTGVPAEQVIVVVRDDLTLFPLDRHWRRFERAAAQAGWTVDRQIPLPSGGEVVILHHPDRAGT